MGLLITSRTGGKDPSNGTVITNRTGGKDQEGVDAL